MFDLSEEALKSIESLAELMLPDRIDLSDIRAHLRGYSKRKAVEEVVERAKRDPLITKLKLGIAYTELRKLAQNGGLL